MTFVEQTEILTTRRGRPRLPLAAWAAARWGSVGIWWVISLTAIARALAIVWLWRAGGWKRKSV